jgi:hypothetical protein
MKLEAALIGLVGVIIGAILATIKDWWFHRAKKKEDQTYLAIQVSCLLERFTSGCLEVAYDDGLFQGQRDEKGCLSPQVKTPNFEPLKVDVNWKSLPTNLMYKILRLPGQVDDANAYIRAAWEHASYPPDFEELFEARIEKYAELGLIAIALVEELQGLAKLTSSPNADEWDPKSLLQQAYNKVKDEINARNQHHQLVAQQMSEHLNVKNSNVINNSKQT